MCSGLLAAPWRLYLCEVGCSSSKLLFMLLFVVHFAHSVATVDIHLVQFCCHRAYMALGEIDCGEGDAIVLAHKPEGVFQKEEVGIFFERNCYFGHSFVHLLYLKLVGLSEAILL